MCVWLSWAEKFYIGCFWCLVCGDTVSLSAYDEVCALGLCVVCCVVCVVGFLVGHD